MTTARFCRFVLRTTDVDAAASFYDAVLGHRGDGITHLPEQARARGARPHWLGHLDVSARGGAAAVAAGFIARGATRLGPPDASDPILLRDPGGAVVALCTEPSAPRVRPSWLQLNATGAAATLATYAELLGWQVAPSFELAPHGTMHAFRTDVAGDVVGAVTDVAGRPGVHSHWLFFFPVRDLDAALGEVARRGGTIIGPEAGPDGRRSAACDDAQGAAFGLREDARA